MTHRVLVLTLAVVSVAAVGDPPVPHLRQQGTAVQLIVDGAPFVIRGGELGNSSGEPAFLRPSWPRLAGLKLNTVLAPVYWDVMEPAEGRFDFATVDGLVADARANGMRLVLLWFGSWKNSMSCYAPAWVKRDTTRFPRSRDAAGRSTEILSPFSSANRDTDARAFAALLQHLADTDAARRTVIMVQVENEMGMIPDARDHSAEADRAWAASVPADLMGYLTARSATLAPELRALWQTAGGRTFGSWNTVFGDGPTAEEVFMAWHFARYTQAVASAGKSRYPLPMYANAALIRPGYTPGQYPSAGPLPHLIDLWRAGAPAIDFIAPDIYFPNFVEWTGRFVRSGNPLFVPEALRSSDAAANALYAVGARDAIGFCPFSIESITEPAASALTSAYDLLTQLAPLITEHQGRGTMTGLLSEQTENRGVAQQVRLGGWTLNTAFERGLPPSLADGVIVPTGAGPGGPQTLPAGGLVIATGPDEFVFAGIGVTVTFTSFVTGEQAGILSAEEGHFVDGRWLHERWLNGDQTHQGRHIRLEPGRFGIQRVKLYRYR
jgi:beta-galactosidase GanA